MSKGSKQRFKTFQILNINDALVALNSLIVPVIMHLDKYKEYSIEAQELLLHYSAIQSSNPDADIIIPAKEYDSINDKLLCRQKDLLKYLADHQASSFSYLNLRELLLKQKHLNAPLDPKIKKVLDELLNVRNWSFHNAQSLLVATKETTKMSMPDELKSYISIQPQLNPVIIEEITGFELKMLMSLFMHTQQRIDQFSLVLQSMQNDYLEMYKKTTHPKFIMIGEDSPSEIAYVRTKKVIRFTGIENDISQLSMGIQKSQYDGSQASYNELTQKHKSTT